MTANLLIACLGLLGAAGALYLRYAEALRRTREMRALAGRMGWTFQPRPSLEVVADRRRFGLFSAPLRRRMRNHMAGAVDDYRVAVFDLEHASAHGDGPRHTQTVVHVHGPRLRVPAFSLRPETVHHRPGDSVGGGDIDFAADEAFSLAYQLRGPNENRIRAAFDAGARDLFLRSPGSSADANRTDLLLWRRGETVETDAIPALAQAALDLAARLSRAAAVKAVA